MRATAKAQPNIALIKYWGKRDVDKNLPAVSSLSVTLDTLWTKMTVEFPVANGRVWPYLTGGGGVGSLRQTVTFRNLPLPLAEGLGPQIFPGPEIDITATDLALTFGGGVDVRLWNGLAVGGAVSYLRLFDDTDAFDFAFVTSRISYRF